MKLWSGGDGGKYRSIGGFQEIVGVHWWRVRGVTSGRGIEDLDGSFITYEFVEWTLNRQVLFHPLL